MNESHVPRKTEGNVAFPEYESRWRLARDVGVFEIKLAVDGIKDLIMAPLALAAFVADMVMPKDSRGVFLRAALRIGERFESWLNLYGLRRRDETRTILDEGGSDIIVDYLESKTVELHRGLRHRRKDRSSD